jgi:hypothetical protein
MCSFKNYLQEMKDNLVDIKKTFFKNLKENQMISNWISERVTEASSHQGLMVAVVAAMVLFGGFGLTKVLLWGALVWGVWAMFKKE